MLFAEKIRELKVVLNLSTPAMARTLGVNIGSVNNWVRRVAYPGAEISRRIDRLAGWREGATWDMICDEKWEKSKKSDEKS